MQDGDPREPGLGTTELNYKSLSYFLCSEANCIIGGHEFKGFFVFLSAGKNGLFI